MTLYIVVTGGVLSGLGKGVAAASIGNLLSEKHHVIPIKCDGYLNVDPGTMNPIEHGEVFVLDDGGEVDMDFGHYERFLGVTCKSTWNLTMGKVFQAVCERERKGDYLGRTVQFIPHVTDTIKDWWKRIAEEERADVVMIEIGGTVGDIENELYVEAARQLRHDVGPENILYVHLTYIPIPGNVGEQKSKPTQQSVQLLRERGIQPDVIIGRCSEPLSQAIKTKIAQFCDVRTNAVITGLDVDTVYKLPLIFKQEGITSILRERLHLDCGNGNPTWQERVENLGRPDSAITIGVCGKYTQLEDSYASIIEALKHCEAALRSRITITWVDTSTVTSQAEAHTLLNKVHGVIVPGGFGTRGVEGKIHTIRYCRENTIPFLGICYGMQLAVVEFARNVCGLKNANTQEVSNREDDIVCILPEQKTVTHKGGTMRLGGHTVQIKPGTQAHRLFGSTSIRRRFRHRYEINPHHIATLEKNGLVFSGKAPDRDIMQVMELPNHPYFMAAQFHPELTSGLLEPSPLFLGLAQAARERALPALKATATSPRAKRQDPANRHASS
ncbi:MAG: CTP synthase (glutamine hydrolyzing) [Nitrosarchaeum sp.]|nr:CTP synthase (glutamine hydrolyzing) [Nitrosarchaeum sp.]